MSDEIMSNYTPRAQKVLELARKEADRFNHNFVATEHVLLGLIKLGQGTAVNVLQKMGLDLDTVRLEVEKQVGTGPDQKVTGRVPLTPRVKKVLNLASKEAKALNHTYVGTEHILLGILREGDGVAALVLKNLDVDIDQTRQEILEELDPSYSGEGSSIRESGQPRDEKRGTVKTPALNAFGRDLTGDAQKGVFDHIVGDEADIQRIFGVLCRHTRSNPVVVGSPGVGKTSLVYGLARAIVHRHCPLDFADKRIVLLDIALLYAGTKYRGQMEERIKAVLDEVRRAKNVVLVIEDLATLVNDEGQSAVFNIMRPEFSRGEVQCIFTAQEDDFQAVLKENRWLEPLVQPVLVESKATERTLEILKQTIHKYEQAYRVTFAPDALPLAVELSDLYFPERRQPANALGLIDEAGSRVYMQASAPPAQYHELERQVQQVRQSKEDAIRQQDYEGAFALRDQEKKLKEELDQVLAKWREASEHNRVPVDGKAICRIVSELTGVAEEKVWKREGAPPRGGETELSDALLRVPKFEQLQTESVLHGYGVEIERGTGFVLLPHTDQFRGIFEYAIKPAMEASGILVKKAEDIYQPGSILAQVWERIRKAEVIVADLSGKNANVIYELGLCYSIQRCPILLVRDPAELPFNLRNLRYIEYKDSAEGTADLKRRLTATIEEFLAAVRIVEMHAAPSQDSLVRSETKDGNKVRKKPRRSLEAVMEKQNILLSHVQAQQQQQLAQAVRQSYPII